MAAPGKLYLVPAPLDFGCAQQAPLDRVMPAATLATAARLDSWICENAKSTRAYLKRVGEIHPLAKPVQEQQIVELPREVHKQFIDVVKAGRGRFAFDSRLAGFRGGWGRVFLRPEIGRTRVVHVRTREVGGCGQYASAPRRRVR